MGGEAVRLCNSFCHSILLWAHLEELFRRSVGLGGQSGLYGVRNSDEVALLSLHDLMHQLDVRLNGNLAALKAPG